jgi:hypothetical protein
MREFQSSKGCELIVSRTSGRRKVDRVHTPYASGPLENMGNEGFIMEGCKAFPGSSS